LAAAAAAAMTNAVSDNGGLDASGIRGVLREHLGLDCDDLELARLWASAFTPDEQVLASLTTSHRA
jgi:hypothetical protein